MRPSPLIFESWQLDEKVKQKIICAIETILLSLEVLRADILTLKIYICGESVYKYYACHEERVIYA